RRQRGQRFQFHNGGGAAHGQSNFSIGRDRPQIRRLVCHAEFVTGMVLRETAIFGGVWSASGAGSQVRDQFLQLDRGPSDFDPDKDFSLWRSHEQIEIVRMGMMSGSPRLEK